MSSDDPLIFRIDHVNTAAWVGNHRFTSAAEHSVGVYLRVAGDRQAITILEHDRLGHTSDLPEDWPTSSPYWLWGYPVHECYGCTNTDYACFISPGAVSCSRCLKTHQACNANNFAIWHWDGGVVQAAWDALVGYVALYNARVARMAWPPPTCGYALLNSMEGIRRPPTITHQTFAEILRQVKPRLSSTERMLQTGIPSLSLSSATDEQASNPRGGQRITWDDQA
ncbi:hypothetical protein IE81DRAFT_328292 [Ceraceosorus guamensis]|uniref:Uncharacterized protein n=1 Tax=Ceraceosorus guamensis TaxID=1522189 RepID=A0A316W545_9BASI|nr:hypothetical protein IE81DRAFT_328292 [Ceraceosorus guamensis]PWN44997.1 hypothetical protein IE81DRAFT_328292 [Ceraceosorus guamensis]